MHLSDKGKIAQKFWQEIPNHFPFVVPDVFVIPNHIHWIFVIDKRGDGVDGCMDGAVMNHKIAFF